MLTTFLIHDLSSHNYSIVNYTIILKRLMSTKMESEKGGRRKCMEMVRIDDCCNYFRLTTPLLSGSHLNKLIEEKRLNRRNIHIEGWCNSNPSMSTAPVTFIGLH